MTVDSLIHLWEADDKIELKEAKHNYPFAGGSHREQAERFVIEFVFFCP